MQWISLGYATMESARKDPCIGGFYQSILERIPKPWCHGELPVLHGADKRDDKPGRSNPKMQDYHTRQLPNVKL